MSTVAAVAFMVAGDPIPQGSKSAYVVNGRAVMADANKNLKGWRKAVTAEAVRVHHGEPLAGPLAVSIEFRLVRPKTVRREHPHVKPDLDKLIRSIFDGITDSGVWGDDGQVVTVKATKVYADKPGAVVRIGHYETKEQGA